MTPDEIAIEEFEKIEKYIQRKMLPEEKSIFEAEIRSNPKLKHTVEENQMLIRAVEIAGFRSNLERIHDKKFGTKVKKPAIRPWLAMAAGIILLIAAGLWLTNSPETEERIFAQYATIDPGLPVPLSGANDYIFQDAMVDYKAGKYDVTIEKWSTILNSDPESNVLNYYIGAAHFNLKKYEDAVPYFRKAADDESSEYEAKAQWYLLLSQLKLKNNEEVLSISPVADSPYREQIEEIQKKLKAGTE